MHIYEFAVKFYAAITLFALCYALLAILLTQIHGHQISLSEIKTLEAANTICTPLTLETFLALVRGMNPDMEATELMDLIVLWIINPAVRGIGQLMTDNLCWTWGSLSMVT